MNKVYCKNCKWFDGFYSTCVVGEKSKYFTIKFLDRMGQKVPMWKNKNEFDKECHKFGISDTSNDGVITGCEFNRNFNCKYYKKSWWKVWLPKIKNKKEKIK